MRSLALEYKFGTFYIVLMLLLQVHI